MQKKLKSVDHYQFDPDAPIGKGCFGQVFKGTSTTNPDLQIAIKMIPSELIYKNDTYTKLFKRELHVLQKIKGDHIVQLIDTKRTTNNLYILLEYCDGGNLEEKLDNKVIFSEKEALAIIKQVALAFVTLLDINIEDEETKQKLVIMHRDIKPANILFHQGIAKIADFGFAKFENDVEKDIQKAHTRLGSPAYMCPEILGGKKYSSKCDVWSTGMMLYELLFQKLPWEGNSVPQIYKNITEIPLEIPKDTDEKVADLVRKMLEVNDELRIGWKEVFEHEAMKDIEIPKVKEINSEDQKKEI